VFVLVTLAALGAAGALIATRSLTYEATAELLVTPLQQDDRTFLGIPLLRDSGDPTRTVQTASALIASRGVAARTALELGGGETATSVEEAIKVEPIGESNIVGVTAQAPSAGEAVRLADTYAKNALAQRFDQLRRQIVSAISDLQAVERRDGGLSSVDRTRLTELFSVRDRGDPSLSLAQPAQPPTSPTDPPTWLVLLLAFVAGVTLGAIVAVLVDRLDRRVRDVGFLQSLAPIPILARVPLSRRGERGKGTLEVPPGVFESFRTLQMQIDQRRLNGQPSESIVVTSGSSGDGKTTVATCLALALANSGSSVILIDCDLRWPDVASRLGLDPLTGLTTLLTTSAKLEELLQPVDTLPAFRVLTAAGGGDVHLLASRRMSEVLTEARTLADYVIVDTAPLGVVSDALSLVRGADVVLLVQRLHHSDRRALQTAVELLERANTRPTGWIVIGDGAVKRKDENYYAGQGAPTYQRRRRRR
jgi:capsular exopolysaccharide synthesis family protein